VQRRTGGRYIVISRTGIRARRCTTTDPEMLAPVTIHQHGAADVRPTALDVAIQYREKE
jgi:hypothetical protein